MSDTTTKQATSPAPDPARRGDFGKVLREIAESSTLVVVLAIVASLLIGGILVVLADTAVQEASGYFFQRPGDTFAAMGEALGSAYKALFEGSVIKLGADSFVDTIRPFTNSLVQATPLIFAALGLGIGFRAGLFNIGAQGQVLIGATMGAWVGFAWHLPPVLHLVVAVVAAALGGAIWAAIAGVLKATTGAHEVIVTIMLNYIAANLVAYLLSLDAFQRPDSNNPQSPIVDASATYPLILGSSFKLNLAFVLAILAAFGCWWFMERSTLGFTFRAVGANPHAARTAGMNVGLTYVLVMAVAGGLAGLGGSTQVLIATGSLTAAVAGSIGFDAITVALLGRSRPLGIVLAAILFGGLRAAGPLLQANANLPIEIVSVIQSVIVLFIAAPPLVRWLFRLPSPAHVKEVAA